MAANDELSSFVKDALAKGASRPEIEEVLLKAGWQREQVHNALAGYADVPFAVPVPRPKPYVSAREAFLYLVLFTALYIAAFHVGVAIFQLINYVLPAPIGVPNAPWYSVERVRWAISSIIVALPVFLFVSRVINRAVQEDPAKRASKVRRWLTYLTLFVTVAIMIGDFTALISDLLGNRLTLQFVLKVLTVACIAGGVFIYYYRSLKADEEETGE